MKKQGQVTIDQQFSIRNIKQSESRSEMILDLDQSRELSFKLDYKSPVQLGFNRIQN